MDFEPLPTENDTDRELFRAIAEHGFTKIRVGFSPDVLTILDDEEAKSSQIEALKDKLDQEVVLRLFAVANSVRYGKLYAGSVHTFFDVVMRLGMAYTKVLIAALSFSRLSHDKEYEAASARSFATSLLARLIAHKTGASEDDVHKVELGGLFLEMGKLLIRLYRATNPNAEVSEEFISCYHPYLGIELIRRLELPEFLAQIVAPHPLTFEEDALSISALVDLAHSVVNDSFNKHGKLVVASPLPDSEGYLATTIGSVLLDQFAALGLEQYLEVIPLPSRRERMKAAKPSRV
jgi:hypothetical protein